MRFSMTLRAAAQCASALAVAIAAFSPGAALAGGPADAIAGKFAADEAKLDPKPDENTKWLRDEARRAVERALAKDNEQAKSNGATATGGSKAIPADNASTAGDQSSPPLAEPTPPAQLVDTAGEHEPDTKIVEPKAVEAEGRELADKLRDVRRKHQPVAPVPGQSDEVTGKEEPGLVETAVSGIATKVAGYISPLVEKRVSILIVMDVGNKGVRKWSKTADPMVCIHEFCYLSRGPEKSADRLTRSAAFGPTVALGKRGQACRSSPACIFRNIDLETVEAKLQPVDLRFLRHDRREAKTIRADASCAIFDGNLSCRAPVTGEGWRAWVVPETVAEKAGAEALKAAMAKGLE